MKRHLNHITITVITSVITVIVLSCNPRGQYVETRGCVWNTTYTIKYQGSESLLDSVSEILHEVEMSLSPFNPRSLISLINRSETDSVNDDIVTVFNESKRINGLSQGAFDPTLSPLINLWGFGYEGRPDSLAVSDNEVNAALSKVGLDSCSITAGRITKKSPETTFNFSAITKGYGCDRIGEMLGRNGCHDYMIEIGGELSLKGVNDRGKPWRVMIEYPTQSTQRDYQGLVTVSLTDCGMATSGNYRNFHDTDRGRIGHTISAVTGYPVETTTLSATVIAPSCMTADALATACMAMPPAAALEMIKSLEGVECMLVTAGDNGELEVKTTAGFPR